MFAHLHHQIVKKFIKKFECIFSTLKNTKVLTISGYKEISKIKIGDKVLSYNSLTNTNEYSSVSNVYEHINKVDVVYSLKINNQVLKVTSSHPFYIKLNYADKYEWVEAKDLNVGDMVTILEGNNYPITNISSTIVRTNFYNIEVENNHNYYVTENNILVHNKH